MLFILEKIIYWNSHETVLFAVEELRRLMRIGGNECIVGGQVDLQETKRKETTIILILASEYNAFSNELIEINDDGFAWINDGANLWIIGNEARSILYGVYEYCKRRFGYKCINLDEELITITQTVPSDENYIHKPMFTRRGNIFETINDPVYINSTIDWGVKNGQNEYFFTFFLWDQVKLYVAPELRKRNVNVTLGGHSLSYLLNEIQQELNTGSLQEVRLKFFGENTPLQDEVIRKIVAICKENEVITRISLWPEDIGIDEKSAEGFLQTYIRFTERLKDAIVEEGLSVEIEYIVYNAGLSWNMLEREVSTDVSEKVDALYAYWGRDYSTSIDSQDSNQTRAHQSLRDWTGEKIAKHTQLTVLEYYSDHYMLSELFPPLPTRIKQDLIDYKKFDFHGILNLIVPKHQKDPTHALVDNYPWKWIHHFNNYVYSRFAWGDHYEDIINEYFSLFGEEKELFKKRFFDLEELLAQQTKFNVPLFPARVVDPEKVDLSMEINKLGILTFLRQVEDLLSNWDLSEIEPLLPIQTNNNYYSFSTKEMTLFYFHHLKESISEQIALWSAKLE